MAASSSHGQGSKVQEHVGSCLQLEGLHTRGGEGVSSSGRILGPKVHAKCFVGGGCRTEVRVTGRGSGVGGLQATFVPIAFYVNMLALLLIRSPWQLELVRVQCLGLAIPPKISLICCFNIFDAPPHI